MLKKSQQQIINELLDSDDELPSDYIEEPEVPAYQNNARFEEIKFNWIDRNFAKYYEVQQTEKKFCITSLHDLLNEDLLHEKTKDLKMGEKSLILSGSLSQQDLYCLKSVEPLISDATMIWFIKFLMYKDLQSQFGFLKACLVDKSYKSFSKPSSNSHSSERKKYNFDIVIAK